MLVFISQIQPAERAGGARFSFTELTAERHLQLPRVQLLLFLETTPRSGVLGRARLAHNNAELLDSESQFVL